MLGPLCVACSVFVLPEYDPADGSPNLWGTLRSIVCKGARDRKNRIAINDSKKLKGAKDGTQHPLKRLERGVLAFMGDLDRIEDDDALFALLGIRAPDHGWYQQASTSTAGGQRCCGTRPHRSATAAAHGAAQHHVPRPAL